MAVTDTVCVPDLADLDAAASCDELDNMGGIANIWVNYWENIKTFPDRPRLSAEAKTFDDAGKWQGDFVCEQGKPFMHFSFKDEAASLTFQEQGEKGSLKVLHTLTVSRNKIESVVAGFTNAVRNSKLVIVVEDNNGVKFILGDKRVPCYMASGQTSTVGEKREDTSLLNLQFEYTCTRLLTFEGSLGTTA